METENEASVANRPNGNNAPKNSPLVKGVKFDDVFHEVRSRADQLLADRIQRVADLRMTTHGHLAVPENRTFRLNDWSKKQLSSLLGIRWNRWFQTATPEELAEEVTRRLSRTPGDIKIRAAKDATGEADGIVRALLSPSFTPIDDMRIFERMHALLRSVLAEEYRFTRVESTDSTTHYAAIHVTGINQSGDIFHPGWNLRNSEVGGAALTLDDLWLRLACTNGLLLPVGGKRLLYRTHRRIDDDQLAAALVIALGRLPDRWGVGIALLRRAREISVPHPDAAVESLLDDPRIPRALVEEARSVALRHRDDTRFGVVQAVTYVAHAKTGDPDVRFRMEQLAGEYLAAG